MHRKNGFLTVFSGLVLSFMIIPLLIIVISSVGKEPTIAFPIKGFTLNWYHNVFLQADFVDGFKTSLIVSSSASLISLIFSVPAVYAITRSKIPHKKWFSIIFLSPTFVPEIIVGFMLYQTLVISCQIPIIWALLIGYFLLGLPYAIRLLTASMLLLDKHVEEAAWMYGCSPIGAFFKVVLPGIYPSMIAAFILSFINAFNNIPISLFMNGPDLSVLPTSILNYLQNNYDPTVAAISTLLMIFTALVVTIMEKALGLTSVLN